MAEFPIPEGYYLLAGKSKENARQALAEAEENGFPAESVLTRNEGFLIPLPEGYVPEGADVEQIPDESWKVPEIDAWAADEKHLVEFPEGARKADKLALVNDWIAANVTPVNDQEVE